MSSRATIPCGVCVPCSVKGFTPTAHSLEVNYGDPKPPAICVITAESVGLDREGARALLILLSNLLNVQVIE